MPALRNPKYRCQKSGRTNWKDLAFVEIGGKRTYLGEWGSDESKKQYDRIVSEWLANGRQLAPELEQSSQTAVLNVCHAFWEWAKNRHRKADGTPTPGQEHIRQALKPLLAFCPALPAADFGPKKLKNYREHLVKLKSLSRETINAHVKIIKRMFRWAVSEELVPAELSQQLDTVEGFRKGECDARESSKVRPVPPMMIEAVKPFCSRQVKALIDLQLLTGARAGELVNLRPSDFDKTGQIWIVRKIEHKTAHHGIHRELYFNHEAQDVLTEFLVNRAPEQYLFSPAEAEEERRAERHKERKTPMSCGNTPGSNVVKHPKRKPGEHYTVTGYRQAIARASRSAFPYPSELTIEYGPITKEMHLARRKWIKDHCWHPHQLRHNYATDVRRIYGIEASRIMLGHSAASVTEGYAEADRQKAIAIAAKYSIRRKAG